jgi:uncharacterized membrane protein
MEFTEGMSKVAQAFELVGVGILIVGAVLVAWTTVVALIRKQPAYEQSRIRLGRTLLLSLEVLVAADVIKTVAVESTVESVVTLGVLVVVRTVLSLSLDAEVDGIAPWRKKKFEAEQAMQAQTQGTASGVDRPFRPGAGTSSRPRRSGSPRPRPCPGWRCSRSSRR